jgi:hypothetical protein
VESVPQAYRLKASNAASSISTFSGTIPTSATSPGNEFVYSTAGHDFNGDGYSDITWRDTNGDVAMWLMNGPLKPTKPADSMTADAAMERALRTSLNGICQP